LAELGVDAQVSLFFILIKNKDAIAHAYTCPHVYAFFLWNQRPRLLNSVSPEPDVKTPSISLDMHTLPAWFSLYLSPD
jgi:hypothetical protein